jgi:hypothetical protein
MQSTNLRQIKAAIRDQAFDFACAGVLCHWGRRRGQAAQGTDSRHDTRLGWTLVSGGQCIDRVVNDLPSEQTWPANVKHCQES